MTVVVIKYLLGATILIILCSIINYLDVSTVTKWTDCVQHVEVVLHRRRLKLDNWCSNLKSVPFIDYQKARDTLVEYNWMFSSEHNLFYCSIPKVASTTMKKSLLQSKGIRVKNNTAGIHEKALPALSVSKWNKNTSALRVPLAKSRRNPFSPSKQSKHSLIIVRNPYERLVSAYRDKIVNKGGDAEYLRQFCESYEPASEESINKYKRSNNNSKSSWQVDFREFIDCVLSNDIYKTPFFNDHIFPMNLLCSTCLIHYDFIGKFIILPLCLVNC